MAEDICGLSLASVRADLRPEPESQNSHHGPDLNSQSPNSESQETLADPSLSGLKQVQYFCYEGESKHWKATWNKVVHGPAGCRRPLICSDTGNRTK